MSRYFQIQTIKRGVFHSIVALQAAINRFLKETNDHPKPFVWTADPDEIIAAVKRGYQTLESSQRRVRQPVRVRSLRILATNETRIVDEAGRLGEHQVMALRLFQFLPIILTALALVPSGAHLAALLLIGLFVEARPDLYPKSRNGED